MRNSSFAVLLITAWLAGGAVARAQTSSYSDGAFAPVDWTLTNELLAGGGSASATQVASGGVLGSYRRADVTLLNAGPTTSNAVYSFSARVGAIFNPAVSGPVLSIDYSEASLRIGIVQACGLAIRQGGVIYYGPSFLTPPSTGVWVVTSQPALTAASFDALAAGIQHPDFSTGGAPIELGFFRANSTGTAGPGYSTAGGIDDCTVTVHFDSAVPTQPVSWGAMKAGWDTPAQASQ